MNDSDADDLESLLEPQEPRGLSENSHIIGVSVYSALLIVGFLFGIVTGYEQPRTITVTQTPLPAPPLSNESAKPPVPKTPPAQPPNPVEPPTPEPKKTEPKKTEPKKTEPKKTEPKKTEPKKTPPGSGEVTPVSFRQVLPILRSHCLNCHGATGKAKGDIDLTSVSKMKSSSGDVLVPGKPESSDLYTSITERDMPRDKPKPNDQELLLLRNWILSGAKE